MKDRMTLGRDADVAETAALTLVDDRATDRIIEAADWEHCMAQEEKRYRKSKRRISDAVQIIKRKMGDDYAKVAGAWLRGQGSASIGIPKRTFQHRLKKVKSFFGA